MKNYAKSKQNTVDYYEEIKLEMEEQNEKFIAETNGKNIEIKMEIPTAPKEEEITSSTVFQNVSDPKIPNVLVKTEFIESKRPVTEAFEQKHQDRGGTKL